MFKSIVKKTLRVPLNVSNQGDSSTIATQVDALLIANGFKMTPDLFMAFSKLEPDYCIETGRELLKAVKELIGANVNHNTYFKFFPEGVPNTIDFWTECIIDALQSPSAAKVELQLSFGVINLLDLPKYGRYLHSYEDMVAVHEAFIGSCPLKVLQLGGTLEEERDNLYIVLAQSRVPLSESEMELLESLATKCFNSPQPALIPIRENRAIINKIRLKNEYPLLVDTPTDILRLACLLSEGDVTLATVTKFKSFPRSWRRQLISALDKIIRENPNKLSDIALYAERWKRLFERLHPWEYPYRKAYLAHGVATGGVKAPPSISSRIEASLAENNIKEAINIASEIPGVFFRNLNRFLTFRDSNYSANLALDKIEEVAPLTPARILLGVKEHFLNRTSPSDYRIFTNTKGKTWVTKDTREPLDKKLVKQVSGAFDYVIGMRLRNLPPFVIEPSMLNVVLPKSNKGQAEGYNIMPRGSRVPLTESNLRFFMYWQQTAKRTDYDLSVAFLDENFVTSSHASWTNLRGEGFAHSGDITEAKLGASEFIDIDLSSVEARYIAPQIYIYSGESFPEAKESFFGFMERSPVSKGLPFEPATVKNKSDVRGTGKVALPLVFEKQPDKSWEAVWMNMYLGGFPNFNTVESKKVNASLLAKSVIVRDYLTIGWLNNLLAIQGKLLTKATNEPVVYIGMTAPDSLPEGSILFTPANLSGLIDLLENPTV